MIGQKGSDNIASISYNGAPMEPQQCSWGRSMLQSNEPHYTIHKLNSRGRSFQYVLVSNFTNIHPMSHRSDFFHVALESIFKDLHPALL